MDNQHSKYFISIDPGAPTGVAIFDNIGLLKGIGSIKYINASDYINKLNEYKNKYNIQFAIIENFTPFQVRRKGAYRVNTQVQLCQEIFPNYILIYSSQWNRKKANDKLKREMIEFKYGDNFKFNNSHETDACMMGDYVFSINRQILEKNTFRALYEFSKRVKKYPTIKEKSIYSFFMYLKT